MKKELKKRIKKNNERTYYALSKSIKINLVKVICFFTCEKKIETLKIFESEVDGNDEM